MNVVIVARAAVTKATDVVTVTTGRYDRHDSLAIQAAIATYANIAKASAFCDHRKQIVTITTALMTYISLVCIVCAAPPQF